MRWVIGVLTLALVSGACSSGIESPAETLAGGDRVDSPLGYVLDGLPEAYALCAVTTPSALSLQSDAAASLHVYGDATLDDPYVGPLYGVALFEAQSVDELELGPTTDVAVGDGVGELGGADGVQVATLPADAGRTLTFAPAEGKVAQLLVRNDDAVDLVALAEAVVVRGDVATISPDALPDGFADLGDLYQLEGRAQFRFSLDHQATDAAGAIDDQLTLLGSTGDEASMEAFRFRVPESRRVDVAGAPGVTADLGVDGGGPWVVSWIPEDGLILRVFSFRIEPPELIDVAAGARRVAGDEWHALQDDFDPSRCQQ